MKERISVGKQRAVLAAFCCACLLAACGGGGDGTADGSNSQSAAGAAVAYSTNPYSQQVPSEPLTLGVETDPAHTVTQHISAARGGTVRATGADGALFELTVPAYALPADLQVTMTPVARFTRLPFNGAEKGSAWGVQFEPSGTRFLKVARLRITPPSGVSVPVEQQLAFGWDNDVVQLAVLDPSSSHVDLQVLHFSGYALWSFSSQVDSTNVALHNLRDWLGSTPERRLETVAAERAAAKRRAGLTTRPDPYEISADDFRNYFQSYVDGIVTPRIAAAGGCANNRVAFETVRNVEFTLRAMGEAPSLVEHFDARAVGENLMKQVAEACLSLESVRCIRDHVVTDMITAVQGIDAEARSYTDDPLSKLWKQWRAVAEKLLSQCHQYRLEVNSSSGSDAAGPDGWNFSEQMEGPIELHLSGPVLEFSDPIGVKTFEIVGVGELRSRAYSISYPDACSSASAVVQAPSLFEVTRLAFARSPDGGLGDVRLEYFPGTNPSSHLYTNTCSDPPTHERMPIFSWSNTFLVGVGSDERFFDPQVTGFFLDKWILTSLPVLGGELILATNSIGTLHRDGPITYPSSTTMRLVHTPIQ